MSGPGGYHRVMSHHPVFHTGMPHHAQGHPQQHRPPYRHTPHHAQTAHPPSHPPPHQHTHHPSPSPSPAPATSRPPDRREEKFAMPPLPVSVLSPTDAQAYFAKCVSRTHIGHTVDIRSVNWSCSGDVLASAGGDSVVRTWTVDSSGQVKGEELGRHKEAVNMIQFHPTSKSVAVSIGKDKHVMMWDTRVRKQTLLVSTASENMNCAFSPDGRTVAVGDAKEKMHFLDVRAGKISNVHEFSYQLNEFTWNKSGDRMFVASGNGIVETLHYSTMQVEYDIHPHASSCYAIDLDSSGRFLATGGGDSMATLWNVDDMTLLRTFGTLDGNVRNVSLSHDAQFLASCGEDSVVDISHCESGLSVYHVPCSAPLSSVAWSPKHYLLGVGGEEKGGSGGNMPIVRIYGFHRPPQ